MEFYDGTTFTEASEERWVRLPYDGRTDQRGDDGTLRNSTITNKDGFFQYVRGKYALLESGGHHPSADFRPLAAMKYGEGLGVVERVRTERVIGRACVTGRTGTLPGKAMEPSSAGNAEDNCVDQTGISLREASYLNGVRARLVTVTELEVDPDIPDNVFAPGELSEELANIPGRSSGATATDTITGTIWTLSDPHFRLDGARASSQGIGGGTSQSFLVLLYLNGVDLVDLEQSTGVSPPWPAAEGMTVTVPGFASAHVAPRLDRNEVRLEVKGDPNEYIRLSAVMDPNALLALAPSVKRRS